MNGRFLREEITIRNFLIILLAYVTLFAQRKFKTDLDYAVFPVNEKVGTVEFYYSFYKNTMLPFEKDRKKFVAGRLEILIKKTKNDSVALRKVYDFNFPYTAEVPAQNLIGLLKYDLSPGKYHCVLVAKDLSANVNSDTAFFDFKIRIPPPDRFSLSDIELASSIRNYNVDKHSNFYKNTLEVVPNPSMIYGRNFSVFYFYNEIYNLNVNAKCATLKVEHYILDSFNRLHYRKTRFYGRKNNAVVDIDAVNVKNYPSGVYSLVISVSDTVKHLSVQSTKKFYVYNPGVKDTLLSNTSAADLLATELESLSPEEIETEFQESEYIASKAEINSWNKLTNTDGKRKFLYEFWKRRDANSSTLQNETKIEYFKRVQFANKVFGNMSLKKGWKTDRGRVYIIYGQPSEIERFPNEKDSRPYEIWHYENIEGGVIFVFVDFTGFNDYRLVHSTKRGEVSDVNWRSRIMN